MSRGIQHGHLVGSFDMSHGREPEWCTGDDIAKSIVNGMNAVLGSAGKQEFTMYTLSLVTPTVSGMMFELVLVEEKEREILRIKVAKKDGKYASLLAMAYAQHVCWRLGQVIRGRETPDGDVQDAITKSHAALVSKSASIGSRP
jgi:hypothetical protein